MNIEIGKKYRIEFKEERWKSDCLYEVVKIQSENNIIIGFNKGSRTKKESEEILGWRNQELSDDSGYEFFWVVGKENLISCSNLNLEIE